VKAPHDGSFIEAGMNFLRTNTEGARRMWMDYEGYGMGWHWLG